MSEYFCPLPVLEIFKTLHVFLQLHSSCIIFILCHFINCFNCCIYEWHSRQGNKKKLKFGNIGVQYFLKKKHSPPPFSKLYGSGYSCVPLPAVSFYFPFFCLSNIYFLWVLRKTSKVECLIENLMHSDSFLLDTHLTEFGKYWFFNRVWKVYINTLKNKCLIANFQSVWTPSP